MYRYNSNTTSVGFLLRMGLYTPVCMYMYIHVVGKYATSVVNSGHPIICHKDYNSGRLWRFPLWISGDMSLRRLWCRVSPRSPFIVVI